jgi:transposase InsO family protein
MAIRRKIAEFRHSVIGELCNPYLSKEDRTRIITEKAGREYDIPYSTKTSITEATIRTWLRTYEAGGIEGLEPKLRCDRGSSRILSDGETQALAELLERRPELTATAAVKLLLRKGKIVTEISSSSLSRTVQALGLSSRERRNRQQHTDRRRYAFKSPLESVQADAMHGVPVTLPSGMKKKAILLAFLDDATRRIVFGRFDISEKSILFEDGLKHILLSHGRLGKIYTDNGSTFVSKQTKRIMTILGIHMPHSKPYTPQGRGKIERFFRTVRDQFLRPLGDIDITLDELNIAFTTWLESEYHRSIHSALETTPLEAWLAGADRIKRLNPSVDVDEVFLHHDTRKIYQDSVLSFQGTAFEVPSILIGKTVDIYYDPHPPITRIAVRYGGKNYGEVRPVDLYANTQVKRTSNLRRELDVTSEPAEQRPVFPSDIHDLSSTGGQA